MSIIVWHSGSHEKGGKVIKTIKANKMCDVIEPFYFGHHLTPLNVQMIKVYELEHPIQASAKHWIWMQCQSHRSFHEIIVE